MLRVVLDTNVLISAIISDGRARSVLRQATSGHFLNLLSPAILDEFERKLTGKFKFPAADLRSVSLYIGSFSELIEPKLRFFAVPRDPNHILECAVAGRADLIVSGDQDLLSLHSFHDIPIRTVRAFADSLSPED